MTFEELKPIVSNIIEKENATRDEKLKEVCEKYQIKFEDADRILYKMDKEYNKDLKLKGY